MEVQFQPTNPWKYNTWYHVQAGRRALNHRRYICVSLSLSSLSLLVYHTHHHGHVYHLCPSTIYIQSAEGEPIREYKAWRFKTTLGPKICLRVQHMVK